MLTQIPQVHPLQLPRPVGREAARWLALSAGTDLRWTQPSAWKMRYELRSADSCLATLRVRGLFRPSAVGWSAWGSWTFEPVGLVASRIVVRTHDTFREIATFDTNGSSYTGIVHLTDGRAFLLNSDFWKGKTEFRTMMGELLIRYRTRGLIHLSAEVEIPSKGAQMAELPWLLMLGWCLIVGYL